MRIVVVGAGAVGGVLAARLAEVGADVVAVARGEHAAVMRRDGLTYRDPDRSFVVSVPVVTRVADAAIDSGTVVLLCVKSQHTGGLVDELAACARPSTPVVCFQNGVANERVVGACFGEVHGAVVMMPAMHLEPGVVIANSAPITGLFDLGRADGGVDAVDRGLAAALVDAGFDARAVPTVMRWKYTKLLMSTGNAAEALCVPDAHAMELAVRARAEALAVYDAAGVDYASAEEEAERRGESLTIRPVPGVEQRGSSTWQSLARGLGNVEVDAFNGEIARLGDAHGVPTPVNDLLAHRVLAAAAAGAPPASIRAEDLLAELPPG